MTRILLRLLVVGFMTSCGPSSPTPTPTDASTNEAGKDGGVDGVACRPSGASCSDNGGYDPSLCCSLTCTIPSCN